VNRDNVLQFKPKSHPPKPWQFQKKPTTLDLILTYSGFLIISSIVILLAPFMIAYYGFIRLLNRFRGK